MMMTSASASGGDGGVAGSLSEVQRPTGSSTAIAKFCSTDGSRNYSYSLPPRAREARAPDGARAIVAEESGAAHFGLGGAMLPDLLGPMVRPPAAPSISILVFHRALPDLQRMKHKPDQAFGHREECFVSS
jgi:hypothetical protein